MSERLTDSRIYAMRAALKTAFPDNRPWSWYDLRDALDEIDVLRQAQAQREATVTALQLKREDSNELTDEDRELVVESAKQVLEGWSSSQLEGRILSDGVVKLQAEIDALKRNLATLSEQRAQLVEMAQEWREVDIFKGVYKPELLLGIQYCGMEVLKALGVEVGE